jgi:hypothetical protein
MEPPSVPGILSEPVLVVRQQVKLVEINNRYVICNQHGQQIGSVRQVGQSIVKKLYRLFSEWDEELRHTLQILDCQGRVVLELTRPSVYLGRRSRVVVLDATGHEVGRIVEDRGTSLGFSLESSGKPVGSIVRVVEPDVDYRILDVNGTEVARIEQLLDESMLATLLTTANSYEVVVHRPLDEPLRSLVVASALAVDLVVNQV